MEQRPDPGAVVETIMHRLLEGGASALEVTTHPLWIVGYGPSNCRFQMLREQGQEAYCVSAHGGQLEGARTMSADWRAATKQCLRCGVSFGPRPRDSRTNWAQRRFCSRLCAHGPPRPPDERGTCAQCGTAFQPPERGRRFCSRRCRDQARQADYAQRRAQMRER